jgi:acylphosphatase
METRKIIVYGKVQGVFFRAFVREQALKLGLAGWVMNQSDGSVCLVAEGPGQQLDALEAACRTGPPKSRVDRLESEKVEGSGPGLEYSDFEIRRQGFFLGD